MKKLIFIFTLFVLLISCNSEQVKKKPKSTQIKTENIEKQININDYNTPEKLKKLVASPVENIWIIDVRTENEYINGHIPTAKLFPINEIEIRLNELPKDKYLILYCLSGVRSGMAVDILLENGYKENKVINWGRIRNWPYEKVKGK